jgi:hypothetical protein
VGSRWIQRDWDFESADAHEAAEADKRGTLPYEGGFRSDAGSKFGPDQLEPFSPNLSDSEYNRLVYESWLHLMGADGSI